MKIAIIGTGISGLVAAYLLAGDHDLTVFEAADRIGGHTHTVDVSQHGKSYAVDTGFIVYNERTYPNFSRLLRRLGVESQPSPMSFSVQCATTGLEYGCASLNTLFAQRRNLLRPSFHGLLIDIVRFQREARALLVSGGGEEPTLQSFLKARRFGPRFFDHYLGPIGAAIWSADPRRFGEFPARYFAQFFHNHGLLSVFGQPLWRVICGGSRAYLGRLTAEFSGRIRLRTPVEAVRRHADHVEVTPVSAPSSRYDAVVIATHSDQALRLLDDATDEERAVLGAIPYQRSDVVLHTDRRLLPRSRRAWSSWNYHVPAQAGGGATVTYNMNLLQSLSSPDPFCVTLNRPGAVDEDRVIRRLTYEHPHYTLGGVAAQRHAARISGVNRTFYCGAYWGFGFHEDGVNSALAVARQFGRNLP
jgi:predicted NAD/FAD-binding protein